MLFLQKILTMSAMFKKIFSWANSDLEIKSEISNIHKHKDDINVNSSFLVFLRKISQAFWRKFLKALLHHEIMIWLNWADVKQANILKSAWKIVFGFSVASVTQFFFSTS